MTNIVKFGAAVVAATAILSSNAVTQSVFVGVEGGFLQSRTTLDEIFPSTIDDPSDTSVELGLKGGYDFDTFRIWGGLSFRTAGSQVYHLQNLTNGSDTVNINGKFIWQTNNILLGANYTPSLNYKFKLSLGAYTGLSIVKGEFNGQASYASGSLGYDSKSGVGNLFGVKLGAIYEVDKNNEIEFGVKGDYQTTGIDEFDNILNYGIYVGYNYKF
ncbi:hypothetical protein [Campylobacter porcelli]|uniref:Outer membrane beta-barrel domain protein n=1 Tax=Campylobacter porcelli TaxID=1660073 RepID=A0A1X9SWE3_9BACT|nr:hypothetical protein [Campylobacter sp. RM6137]ARR00449.1 outer membrane beta-barrel domain protein [Campylobacter sp. RM6137]